MSAVPRNRYVIFLAIAVGGCLIDLASKSWIFARLGMPHQQPTEWLWDGVFGLTTSLNEGALFGIGQGWTLFFSALSIIAALGIAYWLFMAGAAADLLLAISLALVTAGIFGNLYDRVGLPKLQWANGAPVYAVRDWLDFHLIRWPIFNLADSFLVCGAGLLIWHAFRSETRGNSELPALHSPEPASSSPAR